MLWFLVFVSLAFGAENKPSLDYLNGLCVATCRYELLGDAGAYSVAKKQCACTTFVPLKDSVFALKLIPGIRSTPKPKEEPYEDVEFQMPRFPFVPKN